ESEVTNAIDDKGFLAGVGGGLAQEIKADEQVAREAHTFPADEEEYVVCGEDEDEHEKHKEIEVGEEAVVAALVSHVAGGVDMDEPADSGDDEEHDHSEVVDLEIDARADIPRDDPGE